MRKLWNEDLVNNMWADIDIDAPVTDKPANQDPLAYHKKLTKMKDGFKEQANQSAIEKALAAIRDKERGL